MAEKSLDFAIRIVKLCKHIRVAEHEYTLTEQLIKSGTSIGANIREAIGGQSKADFIAKMHIALKEVYETSFWLELLYRTSYIDERGYESINKDCHELTKIIARIIKTSKNNGKE